MNAPDKCKLLVVAVGLVTLVPTFLVNREGEGEIRRWCGLKHRDFFTGKEKRETSYSGRSVVTRCRELKELMIELKGTQG